LTLPNLRNIIKQLNQECKTSGARINFGLIYKQLKIIDESEVKSWNCFEELMVMQTHNTAVLRNYAKLLLDIYNDEDTAEMILSQADIIEEISTQNTTNTEAQNEPIPAVLPQTTHPPAPNIDKEQFKPNQGDQMVSNENSCMQKIEQQTSMSGVNRKSVTKKKNKKKSKKSNGGDAIITELQRGGGTGDDNSLMKKMIIVLILLTRFLAIISAYIGTVVYIIQSNNFSQQIHNLLEVCQLAGYSSRFPVFAIQTLFLDIQYSFKYSGVNDGRSETILFWQVLKYTVLKYGKDITVTCNTQPQEMMDINTYIFDIAQTTTQQTKVEPVILSQEKQVSSLIRAMINLAQMAQQLGRLNITLPNLELKTFYSDIQFIIFNTMMPILQSCKQAMISYYEETNGLITETILVQVLLIVLLLVANIEIIVMLFIFFTIQFHKE
ncbi:MAG: hypothetical protein EZS28_033816, partial [Streblomastix strix]